ncbi:MAG: ABC transporter substrate-binding protein [Bdellovibrionota bacterium]
MKTLLVIASLLLITTSAQAKKITIACGAVGQEFELCKKNSEAWAKATGNEMNYVQTPNDADARLGVFFQTFAAKDPSIDVVQIDIIWPGALANHLIDLRDHIDKKHIDLHFPAIIKNNTGANGAVYALPFWTDAGVLYYRKDLLKKYNKTVPENWDQLEETAKLIVEKEKNPKLSGFVWQGKSYEGLTCNILEWLDSQDAGRIIDPKTGEITVNNPKAIKAIERAAKWIGTISPKSVLNFSEEEARGMFQAGNAVFMRNWPYAWKLVNAKDSSVKDKVGVAVLPKGADGGKHSATLGGWNLAVSKYSKNPKEASDLVRYLSSPEVQLERAIEGSYNPTIASLYKDKKLIAANPFFQQLYDVFVNAVGRPSSISGKDYPKVSTAVRSRVYRVLNGSSTAEKELKGLEEDLNKLKKNWSK